MALCAANRWVYPHSGQHKSGCFGVLHSGHTLLITRILYVYPLLRAMLKPKTDAVCCRRHRVFDVELSWRDIQLAPPAEILAGPVMGAPIQWFATAVIGALTLSRG